MKQEEIRKEIEQIINKTSTLLKEKNEWIERYSGYITDIQSVEQVVKDDKQKFDTPEGLSLYFRVSDRKTTEQRTTKFDLRFLGQSVGTVKVTKSKITLNVSKKNEQNKKSFKGYSELQIPDKVDWISEGGTNFRKFFRDLMSNDENDITLKSQEHRLENQLLKEFSKNQSTNKALKNIQPVTLFKCFFQMPTPIGASDHNPKYAKENGGGIDILARITPVHNKPGSFSRLCVMELKDENKPNESQADAMKQAVTYAVFIAYLLRSQSGQDWWDFFRAQDNSKELPDKLEIDVVTVMPKGETEEISDQIFEIKDLSVTLHCHSLYYDNKAFEKGNFEFSGTYPKKVQGN